jgi:hypothetical protein
VAEFARVLVTFRVEPSDGSRPQSPKLQATTAVEMMQAERIKELKAELK